MQKSNSVYKEILLVLMYLILTIYVISFFGLNFRNDEGFTMAMVHHSFLNLVRIDSYDVHPPFYYLILKAFLNITTFWTNFIFVKIIFARLFSFISFILSFFLLSKIFKVNQYHIRKQFLFQIVLLFPSVLFFATQIRMYSFGAFLLILGIYIYQRVHNNYSFIGLSLFFLCMLAASYVQYYYALFAGLFIFILCIMYAFKKRIRKALAFLGLDILLCICYLPWFFYTLSKVMGTKKTPNITIKKMAIQVCKIILIPTGMLYSSLNGLNILCKVLVIAMIYILIFYSLWKLFSNIGLSKLVIVNAIIAIILSLIGAIIDVFGGFEFSDSFLYPSFLIMVFLVSFSLVKMRNKLPKILFIFIALFVMIMAISCNITDYHASRNQVRKYEYYTKFKRNVYINVFNKSNNSNNSNELRMQILRTHKPFINNDNATILMYINKNMVTPHQLDHNKIDLELWTNIKHN